MLISFLVLLVAANAWGVDASRNALLPIRIATEQDAGTWGYELPVANIPRGQIDTFDCDGCADLAWDPTCGGGDCDFDYADDPRNGTECLRVSVDSNEAVNVARGLVAPTEIAAAVSTSNAPKPGLRFIPTDWRLRKF